jgi:hypothetical protein
MSFHNKSTLVLLFFFLYFPLFLKCAFPAEGQLQLSSYYDSNVFESITGGHDSYGLKLHGNLGHDLEINSIAISANILAQAMYDPSNSEESKMVVKSNLISRIMVTNSIINTWKLTHFQKKFSENSSSYTKTDISTFLNNHITTNYSAWIGLRYNYSTYSIPDTFRFNISTLELGNLINFNKKVSLEGIISYNYTDHKDLFAIDHGNDSELIDGTSLQRDKGLKANIHIKYHGKNIFGWSIAGETIDSNSLITSNRTYSSRLYLSGPWLKKTYYHFLLKVMKKKYSHINTAGFSSLRDPETATLNQMHIRIEHMLKNENSIYIQLNFQENESIYNSKYFYKTTIETGIKYSF